MLEVNMAVDSRNKRHPSDADVLLRFQCHRCGNCCRGDGYVFLEDADVRRLAHFFDLSIEEFKKQYTRTIESGTLALKDQDDPDQSCIFLKDNLCVAHEAKPQQCRDFPRKWRPSTVSNYCEGWRAALGLPPLGKKGKHSEE